MKRLLLFTITLLALFFINALRPASIFACQTNFGASPCSTAATSATGCCTANHLVCNTSPPTPEDYYCSCASGYERDPATNKCVVKTDPTCASFTDATHDSTCMPRDICTGDKPDTSDCTFTNPCCVTPKEASCIKHNQSGCNLTGDCCTTENTTCSTTNSCICDGYANNFWDSSLNKCRHYTCGDDDAQEFCQGTVCNSETQEVSPGTCPTPKKCCKDKVPDGGGASATPCTICETGYYFEPVSKKCTMRGEGTFYTKDPTTETCPIGHICYPGCGCDNRACIPMAGFSSRPLPCSGGNCKTAIGNISVDPSSGDYLIKAIFRVALSMVSGIAVLLIIMSGFKMMSSQGNPEKLQNAREQLFAAIVGLLFVILSYTILRFIGMDLLNLFP